MPFIYFSLDVPKLIINNAIGGSFNNFSLLGIELTQIEYLLALSVIFLSLVVINGAMKYVINVYRGVLGERMLRRLRYTLYGRIIRFPLPHFKKVSSSEIIPMKTAGNRTIGGIYWRLGRAAGFSRRVVGYFISISSLHRTFGWDWRRLHCIHRRCT